MSAVREIRVRSFEEAKYRLDDILDDGLEATGFLPLYDGQRVGDTFHVTFNDPSIPDTVFDWRTE